VLRGLVVYPENMRRNLDLTGGLPFSQRLLLELTRNGLRREEAYALVQENALQAWEGGATFQERVLEDPRVLRILDRDAVAACFDLAFNLRNVDAVFDRVLATTES
jgi:adenylosuccinate lyase